MLLLHLLSPGPAGSLPHHSRHHRAALSQASWGYEGPALNGPLHTLRAKPPQVQGFPRSPREIPEQLTKQRPN